MRRGLLFLLVALCSVPAVASEGMYFSLEGGYAIWKKDDFRNRLQGQLGTDPASGIDNTSLLVDRQLPDGGSFGMRLGYNIAGHLAFEASATLRPYQPAEDTRGGAAIGGFTARWFPLHGLVRPSRRFDFSLNAGMDYVISLANGIHGPAPANPSTGRIETTGRGFDGIAAEFGVTLEAYPSRGFSIGLTPRWYVIDPIRYFTSYDDRLTNGAQGISGKGALSLYSIALALTFHFSDLPE